MEHDPLARIDAWNRRLAATTRIVEATQQHLAEITRRMNVTQQHMATTQRLLRRIQAATLVFLVLVLVGYGWLAWQSVPSVLYNDQIIAAKTRALLEPPPPSLQEP